jgi:hypothetical protein
MLKDKYIKKFAIHKNSYPGLNNKKKNSNKPILAVGTTTRIIFRNNMKKAKDKYS